MVLSSPLAITTDGERFTCGDFSLSETVCLGSFEFITDCFDGLSLSPRRKDLGTAFMGSTCSGSLSPWAMIEDSTKEFYTASSGEGSSGLPFPHRHDTGAPPAPIATTPWLKDILGIAIAQLEWSSLQRRAEASVLSPWGTSSNQLSHIHNSIFF
jgi:hypothetical protein